MGMILDFQKRGGFRQYISPEMAAFKPEYKSQPEGYWTWGSIIMGGIAYNPNNVPAAEAPKTWEDLLDPKWTDAVNVKVSNSGLQHGIWYMLKPILGEDYFKKFSAIKPRAFDSYVQQYGRLVDGQDKIIMGRNTRAISSSRPRARRWPSFSRRPAFQRCLRPTASWPTARTPMPLSCSWTGSSRRSASRR
jgi:ABC-type Fe3+ transport system substrate-binding protein